MVQINVTCMQAPVSLRSPSWNKASDIDATIGEVSVDATLRGFGKKKKKNQNRSLSCEKME